MAHYSILCLYVSTAKPSESVKLLEEYVMEVHMKSWFEMKKNSRSYSWSTSPVWDDKKSSFLPEEFKLIVHEVIQRNSYFAHPKKLLSAMLFDE